MTVAGSGAGTYGWLDGFRYAYRQLAGNGQITVRLASQDNTAPNALAGIMLRERLTAASRHAFVFTTPTLGAGKCDDSASALSC